ncbi:MAG: anaerobic ribonucleoside-triphosphate reductase activating protein [Christensenellales bacterium]|jgi:pyruvate formate lyase activating enzyme
MIFGGLQKFSTIDYPGKLACVLFTAGCDLDCFYCHNRQLIARRSVSQPPAGEVMAFLKKRQGYLEGVVISGGEPCLQEDLPDFIRQVKALFYDVKLDTNGLHKPMVEALIREKLIDYAAVDVKALPRDSQIICGRADAADRALETIEMIAKTGIGYEARTTLYPGLTMAQLKHLARYMPKLRRWRLNYFREPKLTRKRHALLLNGEALTEAAVKAQEELRKIQPNIIV